MWEWIKNHFSIMLTVLITVGVSIFICACEPKVPSLNNTKRLISRTELQFELDSIISLAQMRMADLNRQEALRNLILQNSLVLIQGQPFNPVGIITGIAALYGITQAGTNVTKVVKERRKKAKENNATT